MGEIKLIFMILGDINKSSIFEAFFHSWNYPIEENKNLRKNLKNEKISKKIFLIKIYSKSLKFTILTINSLFSDHL